MAVSAFSTLRAALKLAGLGTLNRTGVTGTASLGINTGDITLAAGALNSIGVTLGKGAVVEFSVNTMQFTTAATAGTMQVETATAAGTASGNGNVAVTITSAHYPAAAKTVQVAILSGDTASAWATKVRNALAADTDVAAAFALGGGGADIAITEIVANGNDSTLNVALANGTPSPGITPAATSADTTAGVGRIVYESNNKDYQGEDALGGGSGTGADALAIVLDSGSMSIAETNLGFYTDKMAVGSPAVTEYRLFLRPGAVSIFDSGILEFTAIGSATGFQIHGSAV